MLDQLTKINRAVMRALPWLLVIVSGLCALAGLYANAAWMVGAACFFKLDDGIKLHITIHQHDCPTPADPREDR